jgi:hypothetical protein
MSWEQRLNDKFTIGDGCWEWIACRDRAGYGRLLVGKSAGLAHRYIYELMIGPVPEGLELDHLCRNTSCVNPAHLEPVSHQENCRRGRQTERKTHCPRGHPYSGDNLYINPNGSQKCRECHRAVCRRSLNKRKLRVLMASGSGGESSLA